MDTLSDMKITTHTWLEFLFPCNYSLFFDSQVLGVFLIWCILIKADNSIENFLDFIFIKYLGAYIWEHVYVKCIQTLVEARREHLIL